MAARRCGDSGLSQMNHDERSSRKDRWHAVSIAANPTGCASAQALGRARFLPVHAPSLPLPQCTAKESCRCLYKHHADRRANPRRREEITGLRRSVAVAQERRVEPDRRKTDLWSPEMDVYRCTGAVQFAVFNGVGDPTTAK